MTLLFFDGFQDGNTTSKPEWNAGVSGNWDSIQTGRDGGTNGAVRGSSNSTIATCTLPSSAATCIVGTACVTGGATSGADTTPCIIGLCSSGNVLQLVLTISLAGFLEVRRTSVTGTLLGTSSGHTPIGSGQWFYVEMKAILTTATTSTVEVRLNGAPTPVLTITGAATSSVIGNVTAIRLIGRNGLSAYCQWDDLYVCDAVDATATQGQANNDYLGDIRVASLFPTAAGDTTAWTPSAGANWTDVDETPPVTTDYVASAASASGTRDLYNVTDLTGTISKVFAVRVGLYAHKTDAGLAQVKPVVKENSVVTAQAAQALSTSGFALYGPALYVKPSNSGLWSGTDVNNLQVGAEVA
jgi:hypothetical protein